MTWGNPESLGEKALVKFLWPARVGMGTASFARMVAYNMGVLKQAQFRADVISIGNITVGGTGKTPVTIDLAQRLIADGRKVAVLSRGYKRLSKEKIVVVSNGKMLMATSTESGDEPYMIASAVPQATVIVGAKRIETAQLAIDRFGCDTIILDDGFQHFAIARNQDVILIDYNDELENDHLLPAGRLREPLSGLARANWIVITKLPADVDQERMRRLQSVAMRYAPGAQISACRMVADVLKPFAYSDVTLGAATVRNTRVFAFCAIARPESFLDQLRGIGANVMGYKWFPDHHWYTHQDIETIAREYKSVGAEMVITTQKDAVKLLPAMVKDLPLAVLHQKLEWTGPIPVVSAIATHRTQLV
ncbi:MAG TPA: tetraacyldisaccharide 4'-kinase [Candidatus Obscuribacterales bacterium]